MRPAHTLSLAAALVLPLSGWISHPGNWTTEKNKRYTLHYTEYDKENKAEYTALFNKGMREVKAFFGDPFKKEFDIYIYPDRKAMDEQWEKDWNMPGFRSECWMVASGMAHKLDLLSPLTWEPENCEHRYSEKVKTQRLITHELFHVYHGQLNASPDFSATENIDWFVEGLATYASGQCDSARVADVKKALEENKVPASLDQFWTGKLKYGLSGSVIQYIDSKFGRKKLKELLIFAKKQEILASLNVTEMELLEGWKKYVNNR